MLDLEVPDRLDGVGERIDAVDDGADFAAGGHVRELGEPFRVRRGPRDVDAQAEDPPEQPGLGHQSDRAEVLTLARISTAGQDQPAARGDDAAQVPQAPVADQVEDDVVRPPGA